MSPLPFVAIAALWRLRRRVLQLLPGERAPFAVVAHLLEIALLEQTFFISHRVILRAAHARPLTRREADDVLAGVVAYETRAARLMPYMTRSARAAA